MVKARFSRGHIDFTPIKVDDDECVESLIDFVFPTTLQIESLNGVGFAQSVFDDPEHIALLIGNQPQIVEFEDGSGSFIGRYFTRYFFRVSEPTLDGNPLLEFQPSAHIVPTELSTTSKRLLHMLPESLHQEHELLRLFLD